MLTSPWDWLLFLLAVAFAAFLLLSLATAARMAHRHVWTRWQVDDFDRRVQARQCEACGALERQEIVTSKRS